MKLFSKDAVFHINGFEIRHPHKSTIRENYTSNVWRGLYTFDPDKPLDAEMISELAILGLAVIYAFHNDGLNAAKNDMKMDLDFVPQDIFDNVRMFLLSDE